MNESQCDKKQKIGRCGEPIFVLFLLLSPILWLHRLTLGLNIDEAGSAFCVQGSLAEVFSRCVELQSQAPLYYYILWAASHLFGTSEYSLRGISLFAVWGASVCLYKIAASIKGRTFALMTVTLLLYLDSVVEISATARPYGCALFFLMLSGLYFQRWIISLEFSSGIAAIVWGGFAFYTHYYTLPLLLLLGAVTLTKYKKNSQDKKLLGCIAVIVALFSPMFFLLEPLVQTASRRSLGALPQWQDLLKSLISPYLLVALTMSLLLARIPQHSTESGGNKNSRLPLFATLWFILPHLFLFFLSYLLGATQFINRYWVWDAPALAVLIAMLLSVNSRWRRLALSTFIIFCCCSEVMNGLKGNEGWREVIQSINLRDVKSECPVLVASGYVESGDLAWIEDPRRNDLLLAPATYYDLKGRVTSLPLSFDGERGSLFLANSVTPLLKKEECVILIYRQIYLGYPGHEYEPSPVRMAQVLGETGFHEQWSSSEGAVNAKYFRKLSGAINLFRDYSS